MTRIREITRAYVRDYRDSGQVRAYVEWIDSKGRNGRTEGSAEPNSHMYALLTRAKREGKLIEETW